MNEIYKNPDFIVKDPNGKDAVYSVQIWESDTKNVILIKEKKNNPGMSVTNNIVFIVHSITNQRLLTRPYRRWFEQYPENKGQPGEYTEIVVDYKQLSDSTLVWKPTNALLFEELINVG